MKQEPVLAYENSFEIERLQNLVQENLGHMETIVHEYHKLELGTLTNFELLPLVTNTSTFIREKMLTTIVELPSYGGLKMRPEAVLDTLELPDLTVLHKACRAFKKVSTTIQYDIGFFRMKGKSVELNHELLKARLDAFRIYAVTPREVAMFNAYKGLIDAYSALDMAAKQFVAPGGVDNFNLQRLIEKDNQGRFILNENIYRQFCGKF
jgi:hypothetical protein